MASSKQFLEFVLDQLTDLNGVSYKTMMGEFIICYQGKIVGGIYDDRLLIKQTESSKRLLPDASLEVPYEGAKEMLSVEDFDDRDLLKELFNAMIDELPEPRIKRR